MKIKKIKIAEKIFLLRFPNQKDLASTFLRFQEYYESPKFRGKIFTFEEFKEWYSSKNKGKFTYYQDWNGFNIPSKVLHHFKKGKFNPLSEKEKNILEIFKKNRGKFYIIAISGKKNFRTLKHEMAHALFYTEKKYKTKVLRIIKKYDTKKIKKELLKFNGYHKNVLDDEIQAYAVAYARDLKTKFPDKMREKIQKVFEKYSPVS